MRARPRPTSGVGTTVAVAVAVALVSLGACRQDDALDRDEVVAAIAERERLSQADARCVASYAFDTYTDDEIETIITDGVTALPVDRWSEYTHAVAGCGLAAELGVERTAEGDGG